MANLPSNDRAMTTMRIAAMCPERMFQGANQTVCQARIHSLTHLSVLSIVRSFFHSFTYLFIYSLIHSFIYSFILSKNLWHPPVSWRRAKPLTCFSFSYVVFLSSAWKNVGMTVRGSFEVCMRLDHVVKLTHLPVLSNWPCVHQCMMPNRGRTVYIPANEDKVTDTSKDTPAMMWKMSQHFLRPILK